MKIILLCFSLFASTSIQAKPIDNTASNDKEHLINICAMFSTFITDIARQRDAGIDYLNNPKNDHLYKIKLDSLGVGISVGSMLSHAVKQTPFLKPEILSGAYGKTCYESKVSLMSPTFGDSLRKYEICNKFADNSDLITQCLYKSVK